MCQNSQVFLFSHRTSLDMEKGAMLDPHGPMHQGCIPLECRHSRPVSSGKKIYSLPFPTDCAAHLKLS